MATVCRMNEPSPFLVALGEEIRYWRTKRGLTLVQLAMKSGVSKATIERAENATNTISVANTEVLACALQVDLSEMIRRVEDALRIDSDRTKVGTPARSLGVDVQATTAAEAIGEDGQDLPA